MLRSNIEDFQAAMRALNVVLKREPAAALRKEGRLLFQRVSTFTPPKSLAEGRKVVKRDLLRAVRPLVASTFEDKSLRALVRKGNIADLQSTFDRFTSGPLERAVVVRMSGEAHQLRRNKRGRVPKKGQNFVTPDAPAWNRHLRHKQGNVGRARGGWVKSLEGLGATAPTWARRWREMGDFDDTLSSLVSPHLSGTNYAEWASGSGDDLRAVNDAVKSRTVNLRTALEAAISGAAFKSLRA